MLLSTGDRPGVKPPASAYYLGQALPTRIIGSIALRLLSLLLPRSVYHVACGGGLDLHTTHMPFMDAQKMHLFRNACRSRVYRAVHVHIPPGSLHMRACTRGLVSLLPPFSLALTLLTSPFCSGRSETQTQTQHRPAQSGLSRTSDQTMYSPRNTLSRGTCVLMSPTIQGSPNSKTNPPPGPWLPHQPGLEVCNLAAKKRFQVRPCWPAPLSTPGIYQGTA